MATRQLAIQINPAGLTALAAAGERVTLVKAAARATGPVAWQVIAPVGRIMVSWAGSYQVYQSTTAVQAGGRLRIGSTAEAVTGYLYPFAAGQFGTGSAGLGPAEVGIRNADQQITMNGVAMFTGGLVEDATVNDQPAGGPLDAQPVLLGQTAVSSVCERLLVFPAGGITTGTVLSWHWLSGPDRIAGDVVLGQPLVVDLTTKTDQSIHYDPAANRFVPGAG